MAWPSAEALGTCMVRIVASGEWCGYVSTATVAWPGWMFGVG